ncbi:hypothetical protein ADK67_18955 [Saccharothrix sp. NRRL B-16348]|uniref:hypothetical protein n=1 Tax=Saccharothrix sp. NRRL B-16348 TaxID=1415542 RepID=UPI0006AF0DCD|nr:hypothetical protein [Saccharothrix sp. NRRL B-16348]KOX24383.1 hypothetical protein ADK67_18955 [Saccharothrix sp. NRRL B-16348]
MSELERRYRRLLARYPRDHRERHGDEMLAVLMSAAGDRDRPSTRETADLMWAAVRLHLRRVVVADGGVDARDVLAVVSLLAPLALLAGATTGVHEIAWFVKAGAIGSMPWTTQFPDAPVWVLWGVVAVLVLRGRSRAAAVVAWPAVVLSVLVAAFYPHQHWWTGMDAGWILVGLLTAVALTWSPGPARGRELVGRKAVLVMAVTVAATVALGVLGSREPVVEFLRLAAVIGGTLVACGHRSRVGRRAALILLLPTVTMVLGYAQLLVSLRMPTSLEVAVFYGLPVVALLALGGLPRRVRRRPDRPVT